MSLDPHLWAQLEAHGVTSAHLDMLLHMLMTQRNGSWTWQYVNGHLTQCEARLVFPSRGYEVARVCDGLPKANPLLR